MLDKYALLGLCKAHMLGGNFEKVDKYLKTLNVKYPDLDFNKSKEILKCYSKIKQSIDSLFTLGLAKDELLHQVIQFKKELVQCGWFCSEAGCNNEIVIKEAKKLYATYPKSDFADNALLDIIRSEILSDEGGAIYSEETVNLYLSFFEKYPDSDVIHKAKLDLGRIYENFYHDDFDEEVQMKMKALKQLETIDIARINDADFVNDLYFHKRNLKWVIERKALKLEAHPPNVTLKSGEQVQIKVILKNLSSIAQRTTLYKEAPFFSMNSNNLGNYFVKSEEAYDTTLIERTISPMDSIVELITLDSKIRLWYQNQVGQLNIKKPGTYSLLFQNGDNNLKSNLVKIDLAQASK